MQDERYQLEKADTCLLYTSGVGDVVAGIVGKIIPEGNVNVGIAVFAIGMALFTMVMGNAFAAITVMTVGIGAPFVLAYGADPTLIGMLALTCGYCGTLCTPMAANFNVVPVADVYKRQVHKVQCWQKKIHFHPGYLH